MITAWLIERGPVDNHYPTLWWVGDHEWTDNAWKAARFENKADADEVIRREISAHVSQPMATATEHGFG